MNLAALLTVLVLATVPAKLKIIDLSPAIAPDFEANRTRSIGMFSDCMNLLGVHATWERNGTKTEWVRSGIFPDDTADAVMLWNNKFSTTATTSVRSDSLLKSGVVLDVPLLMVMSSADGGQNGCVSSSACTTGVAAGAIKTNPLWGPALHLPGETRGWNCGTYIAGWPMSSYEPPGGRRVLLQSNLSDGGYHAVDAGDHCTPSTAADSLHAAPAGVDTAHVWELLRANSTGSKPAIFADFYGAGTNFDSTGAFFALVENDPFLMIFTLAHLDSLLGGRLITAGPIRLGITIDGGFRHQARASFNGGFAPDSDAIKQSISGLNALHIPAVLGVNVDSVASYPYEKAWWLAWGGLKFSPQSWVGVEDSTEASGNASSTRHADPLGHFRQRAATGPGTAVDTTAYGIVKSAKASLASWVPGNRMSRTYLPALDDWLPANSGIEADSTLYALSLNGFTHLRVNGRSSLMPVDHAGNPVGAYDEQGVHQPFGRSMTLLACDGYEHTGGSAHVTVLRNNVTPMRDTICATTDANVIRTYALFRMLNRVTGGLLGSYVDMDDQTETHLSNVHGYVFGSKLPMDDYQHQYRGRAYLLRFSVNDFGGDPNGPPPRNAYWVIKSLDNWMKDVNKAAGRVIVEWAYPEDIAP